MEMLRRHFEMLLELRRCSVMTSKAALSSLEQSGQSYGRRPAPEYSLMDSLIRLEGPGVRGFPLKTVWGLFAVKGLVRAEEAR